MTQYRDFVFYDIPPVDILVILKGKKKKAQWDDTRCLRMRTYMMLEARGPTCMYAEAHGVTCMLEARGLTCMLVT